MTRKKSLPVSTTGWTKDETDEFFGILDRVLDAERESSLRVAYCMDLLAEARERRASWVHDADLDLMRVGVTRLMSAWAQRVRHVTVRSTTGRATTKTAVRGAVLRDDESGERWVEQSMLVTWTWDQLQDKRRDALKVITSYRDDIALYDAYLALQAKVPDAATPEEALRTLGVTEDEWLGEPDRRSA